MQRQRVVLPESEDPRVLAAAQELTHRGLADIILLGEPEKVIAQARRINIDISQVCHGNVVRRRQFLGCVQ